MATPSYTCANCGYIELADPLNLRVGTQCRSCGEDYRVVLFRAKKSSNSSSALAHLFLLGSKYPKISLILGIATFLISLYVAVFIQVQPWGTSIVIALVLAGLAYLFLVGLIIILIVFFSIASVYRVIDSLGGWG